MEWVRGSVLGHGSFGSVSLAATVKSCSGFPGLMAVKSCQDCSSSTLKNEKIVLEQLGSCPQIVRCLGDECTVENGEKLYNLFLEYASKGSLADRLKKNNGSLEESEVRKYTRSVLKGLRHIHAKGFVHCDVKLQNVLVFDNDVAKIADFGLAKKSGKVEQQSDEDEDKEKSKFECRGTPLYMSPESVNDNEYESPGDIWSLGCAVVEMLTGKPAWNYKQGTNLFSLLIRIGVGEELPTIPGELSEEGTDFLLKCFVKDPKQRWTADMLLNHPFVYADDDDEILPVKESKEALKSPRSPFSFSEWVSVKSYSPSLESENSSRFDSLLSSCNGLLDRVKQLEVSDSPDWSDSKGWITVR